MIQEYIAKLVCYGLDTGLIEKADAVYAANSLLALLKIDALDEAAEETILAWEPKDGGMAGLSETDDLIRQQQKGNSTARPETGNLGSRLEEILDAITRMSMVV